ncbi:flagellar basal body rod protein FlgC [Aurantiacibacter sp. DGU5]|uniref:Flagellar basal-body rod protein FlgC n=2 Tax=Erythrobacteraceae TaxID=335929 RepID=A0ABV0CY95_9SPHN
MTMGPANIFELAQRAMSAQTVRMNAAASNMANAGSAAATEEEAYRPLRPVFAEELGAVESLRGVSVQAVRRADVAPTKMHQPGHPLADENGDVWVSPVDETEEMVEMLEASRQYRNMVEALSTAKQLMLETMRMK